MLDFQHSSSYVPEPTLSLTEILCNNLCPENVCPQHPHPPTPPPCLEMCNHYSDFPGLSACRPPKLQKAKRPRHLVALHCISASFWTFIQFCLSYDIYDVFRKFHLLNRTLQTLSKVSYTKLFFQSGSFSIHLFVEADTDVAAGDSSYGSQAVDKSMHGLEHHNYKLSIYSNCILCSNTVCRAFCFFEGYRFTLH